MGLAPTGVWRVPPIPHCNWRALPSSQSPSLPALSLPLPPTPLGSFCNAGAAQSGVGRGPRVQGGEGRALQRHLGPDPHLGELSENYSLTFLTDFRPLISVRKHLVSVKFVSAILARTLKST